jgi:hypothetical protein
LLCEHVLGIPVRPVLIALTAVAFFVFAMCAAARLSAAASSLEEVNAAIFASTRPGSRVVTS